MLTQRKSTAPTTSRQTTKTGPRLIYARYRGVCKCGRGFLAGEPIEYDPKGRHKRCIRCIEKRQTSSQENGQVLHFDSYRGAIQRLKQISQMPRPLAPNVAEEYWKLMLDISTAPETSRSVKMFLESTARCCHSESGERYVVSLLEDKECVHCFQTQKRGELVLMDFPNRNAHCIWCECTHV